jgi:hypothetical protein
MKPARSEICARSWPGPGDSGVWLALFVLFALSTPVGCSEGWEGHCSAACAVVQRCGLDAVDYPLQTYARYHFCCDPYVDGTTRRAEWEAAGDCLEGCVAAAKCDELDAWIRDRACCTAAGGIGACLAACGGY